LSVHYFKDYLSSRSYWSSDDFDKFAIKNFYDERKLGNSKLVYLSSAFPRMLQTVNIASLRLVSSFYYFDC